MELALSAVGLAPIDASRLFSGSSFGQTCRERRDHVLKQNPRADASRGFQQLPILLRLHQGQSWEERGEELTTVSRFACELWNLDQARLIFLALNNDKELSNGSASSDLSPKTLILSLPGSATTGDATLITGQLWFAQIEESRSSKNRRRNPLIEGHATAHKGTLGRRGPEVLVGDMQWIQC